MPEAEAKHAVGLEEQPAEQPEPVADWESEGGAVLPPGVALTLRGPDGAGLDELDAALAVARTALPAGFRLERD